MVSWTTTRGAALAVAACALLTAACSGAAPEPTATAPLPTSTVTTVYTAAPTVAASPTPRPTAVATAQPTLARVATATALPVPSPVAVPTLAPSPPAVASATAGAGVTVSIFLHDRARLDDPTTVVAVERRVTPIEQRIAAAALQALADGPTPAEVQRGLFSQVQQLWRGPSTCGGAVFGVTLNSSGQATARLCGPTQSGGVLDDARFQAEVEATLRQFPTVQPVRILNVDGHCFGDESGLDRCLDS